MTTHLHHIRRDIVVVVQQAISMHVDDSWVRPPACQLLYHLNRACEEECGGLRAVSGIRHPLVQDLPHVLLRVEQRTDLLEVIIGDRLVKRRERADMEAGLVLQRGRVEIVERVSV